MRRQLIYEGVDSAEAVSSCDRGRKKRHCLSSSICFFSPHIYFALCVLPLSTAAVICGSLSRASPSCASYANAGINHYANVIVNHYANVTVPTCQTGGQASHKDPSFPLHYYSHLPFMIFNSVFFFFLSFNSPPSFFVLHFLFLSLDCSLRPFHSLPSSSFITCFSISPWLHQHNWCWCGSHAKIGARNTKKKGLFNWKLTRFDLFAGQFCSDKLVYFVSVLLSSLSRSPSLCILPLTPALPPLPLKCLLPYIDRAVWHRQGIVVHKEIPLVCVCV